MVILYLIRKLKAREYKPETDENRRKRRRIVTVQRAGKPAYPAGKMES